MRRTRWGGFSGDGGGGAGVGAKAAEDSAARMMILADDVASYYVAQSDA